MANSLPTIAQGPTRLLVSPLPFAEKTVAETDVPLSVPTVTRELLPMVPRLVPEILNVAAEPAGRESELKVRSTEFRPVPPVVAVNALYPWATETAPKVSVEAD